MNIREAKRHDMQCEVNRLNRELQSGNLSPQQFKRANKRRSEILAVARTLRIDVKAV